MLYLPVHLRHLGREPCPYSPVTNIQDDGDYKIEDKLKTRIADDEGVPKKHTLFFENFAEDQTCKGNIEQVGSPTSDFYMDINFEN